MSDNLDVTNLDVAEIQQWAQEIDEFSELIGFQFARADPRNNAIDYILGLLSEEEPKNSWNLSERADQTTLHCETLR